MGRLGGEEFAITMVDCDLQKAFAVSERLRERVENRIINADGKEIRMKISVGVAELSDAKESFDSLMKRADRALYTAKNLGRNRVERSSLPPSPR